jgi:hypothetical protein
MAAAVGLVVVLAGCGTATGARVAPASTVLTGPSAHPPLPLASPVPRPALSPGTTLTAADDRVTVSVVTGQELTVELAPRPGVYAWQRPRLTGTALRSVSVAGGYPDRGPMRAVFLAIAPGTAVISTLSDLPCLHAQPRCAVAQRVWTATVVVRQHP